MIGQEVRCSYVRSLGTATDPDLTGPVPRPFEGTLVTLRVGMPMRLQVRQRQRPWETSPVARVRWLRITEGGQPEVLGDTLGAAPLAGLQVGPDILMEVWTQHRVYRLVTVSMAAANRARDPGR